jgi:exonuclease VII large subunit
VKVEMRWFSNLLPRLPRLATPLLNRLPQLLKKKKKTMMKATKVMKKKTTTLLKRPLQQQYLPRSLPQNLQQFLQKKKRTMKEMKGKMRKKRSLLLRLPLPKRPPRSKLRLKLPPWRPKPPLLLLLPIVLELRRKMMTREMKAMREMKVRVMTIMQLIWVALVRSARETTLWQSSQRKLKVI